MKSARRHCIRAGIAAVMILSLHTGHGVAREKSPAAIKPPIAQRWVYRYAEQRAVALPKQAGQQETIFDNTNGTGGFLPPNQVQSSLPVEFLDWAQSNGGTIAGFQVGYATSAPSPISLKLKFYYGTDAGHDGEEIASFDLTNLPGSTSGQVEVFTLDVDISNTPFDLPPGNFGYSYIVSDSLTGPLTADGGFGATDFYRLRPSPANLRIAGFFAQFFLKLAGAHLAMIFVNNAGPDGDGSFFNPFNNLTRAALAAAAGYIIFVYAGNAIYNGGFVMKPGQKLIGEGAGLTYAGQTVVPPGQNPILVDSTGPPSVLISSPAEVAGFTIEGSAVAIRVEAADDVRVEAVEIRHGKTGIEIVDANGAVRFENVLLIDQDSTGLRLAGGTGMVVFDSLCTLSQQAGASALRVDNGHRGRFEFGGPITVSGGLGLQFTDANGRYTFQGPVRLGGGRLGIDIHGGTTGDVEFLQPLFIQNTGEDGVRFEETTVTVRVPGVEILDPGGAGLSMRNLTGGIEIDSLKIIRPGGDGVAVCDSKDLILSVSGPINIQGSAGSGLRFKNTGGVFSFQNVTIGGAKQGGIAVLDSMARDLHLSMLQYSASDFDGDAMAVFVPLAPGEFSGRRIISWDEATLTNISGAGIRVQGGANANSALGRHPAQKAGGLNRGDSLQLGRTTITRTDSGVVARKSGAVIEMQQLHIDSSKTAVCLDDFDGTFAVTGDSIPGSGGAITAEQAIKINAAPNVQIELVALQLVSAGGPSTFDSFFDIDVSAGPDSGTTQMAVPASPPGGSSSKRAQAGAHLALRNSKISTGAPSAIRIAVGGRTGAEIELTGNTIDNSGGLGIRIETRATATALVTLTGNSVAAAATDYVLVQEDASTFQLAGFAGGDSAAVAAFIRANNAGAPSVGVQGAISADPATGIETPEQAALPARFHLHQNYPNPFNPGTTIRFDLPRAAGVRLDIFTVRGRRVRTLAHGPLSAGSHQFHWDGRDAHGIPVPGGVYFIRISAGELAQSRKAVLLR